MLLAGILLLFVCGALLWLRGRRRAELLEIKATPTIPIGSLVRDCAEIREELDTSGGFLREVEIAGKIQCPTPLNAEITGTPCCYYRTSVVREYEETVETPSSEGATGRKIQRGSEEVSSNTRMIPFQVTDASGSIPVDPHHAAIDAEKICDEFRSYEDQATDIGFGAFRLAQKSQSYSPDRKTIGYRFQEWALPVATTVFIHGVVHDRNGDLTMSLTGEEKGKFLISSKSEDEVIHGLNRAIKLLLVSAILAGILGLGLIVAAAF